METLLEKAQRLKIKPEGQPESLLDKANRLGIKPTNPPEPNYFQRVGGQYKEAGEDIIGGIQKGAEMIQKGNVFGGGLRAGLRTVGGIAQSAFAPILEAPIIKPTVEKIVQKATEIPGARNIISKATDLAIKYPEASADLKNIFDIATLGIGGALEKPLVGEARALGRDISRGLDVALTPSEEAVQREVVSLFQKSIKPTSKKTLAQGEKYENDIVKALKTIKTNSDSLNIEDAAGEIVSRTPQSINELAQGVDQTKKIVFSQYDSLAKQAGTAGAKIDVKPIADELDLITKDKALEFTNPEVIDYAKKQADNLRKFDVLDTQLTQSIVQRMNSNLQAFYRNPTYESASKVSIDALIVNNLRKSLDEAIEGATGKEYQVLKNQYSALKAIENDVVRASMRDAKKNVKGLLDYTDIFTSGQVVGGILTLNPAMFTKGAIERGFKELYKALNDPNRAVGNMFERLDIDTNLKFTPESKTGQFIKNPKLGLSIDDVSKKELDYDSLLNDKIKLQNKIGKLKPTETDFITNTPLAKQYRSLKTELNFTEDAMGKLKQETSVIPKGMESLAVEARQPKGVSLPETISTNLVDKKPSAKLKQFKIGDNFVNRYEGIKTGGSQFETMGKTQAEADQKMITNLQRYKILPESNNITIPKELQPLAQEARKYKTAEEFVKAQGKIYSDTPLGKLKNELVVAEQELRSAVKTGENPLDRTNEFSPQKKKLQEKYFDLRGKVENLDEGGRTAYHGTTPENALDILRNGFKTSGVGRRNAVEYGTMGREGQIYASVYPEAANTFGKGIKIEFNVPKNAFEKVIPDEFDVGGSFGLKELPQDWIRAVWVGDKRMTPNEFLKSQLTDLWEKAKKK